MGERPEDRQRKLNELCRSVLGKFVGREVTPLLIAEAEGCMRQEIDEAVRAGTYVIPDGMIVDRVEVGADLRLKVFFGLAVETTSVQ